MRGEVCKYARYVFAGDEAEFFITWIHRLGVCNEAHFVVFWVCTNKLDDSIENIRRAAL